MARQAIWCGDPDQGLTYVELAQVRADRLNDDACALLHAVRARALGQLGRADDAIAAVRVADAAKGRGRGEPSPWIVTYNDAHHYGDTGYALYQLELRGHRTEAARRFQLAIDTHAPRHERSRALTTTNLASLVMATGDPHEAVKVGHQALDRAGVMRSARARSDLRELRSHAKRHSAMPEVVDLRDRIGLVLASS